MLIGQEMLMKGRAPQVDVSSWVPQLFLGIARNKTVFPCPQQRHNTLLQEATVPNSNG